MKKQDQERRAYNFFHGNLDRNIISQVDLLLKGHGNYDRIFDREFNMVTDLNQDRANADVSSQNSMLSLVIKDYFTTFDEINRYVSGKHFTKETICAPSKTKSHEKITGRAVIDLAKLCLKNLKKAVVRAEEFLSDGELPSGQNWDDLYAHVILKHTEQFPKEKTFTGFMAFVCLTKYNDGGKNVLSVLATKDADNEDDSIGDSTSRSSARKKAKLEKDGLRSIECGNDSVFKNRGMTMDARVQVIEISQVEDMKWREDLKTTWNELNAKNDLLLRERSQQIDLAKIICPLYDEYDENWIAVRDLNEEIKSVKMDIKSHNENRAKLLSANTATTALTQDFLNSVCHQSKSVIRKESSLSNKKRSASSSVISEITSDDADGKLKHIEKITNEEDNDDNEQVDVPIVVNESESTNNNVLRVSD